MTEQIQTEKTNKFSAFIQKHGYSYKSFFIALFVFPPVAQFVIWKMPGASLGNKIFFSILGVVIPLSPFVLGALGVSQLAN